MTSRNLTRESGSSYLVKFFEDNEILVVNRSRIFREGRIKVGDTCEIQWGRNQLETSDGEILEVGEYTDLINKVKQSVTKSSDHELTTSAKSKVTTKNKTVKTVKNSKRKQKENTAPQPRKKLKSGVSKIPPNL